MLYQIADIFFVVFHTSIVLFNLLGWIWKRLRKWNLILLILTGLSWTVLGIWYGFGYCPCTDWHWDILSKLDREPGATSYIEYLIERLTGLDVVASTIDVITLVTYLLLLIISGYVNWRDWKYRKM